MSQNSLNDPELQKALDAIKNQFTNQEAGISKFFAECDRSVQKILDNQAMVSHEVIVLLLGELTIFRGFETALRFCASKKDADGAAQSAKELIEALAAFRKEMQELSAMDEQNTAPN